MLKQAFSAGLLFVALATGYTMAADATVYVFDKGTKPAIAATADKEVEMRPVKLEGKPNPAVMCDDCMEKVKVTSTATKPAIAGKVETYACVCCGKFVWREGGKQIKHTDKEDCAACEKLAANLKSRKDKPGVAK